ncbi:hypothetical protein MRB53_028667 [Persea americana]|uniref:Uncharacterized protein n=1 Tax=Persea americana TaxID=3435 RepID=A0ACC2KGC7_PERAE|nr:hypothetical protein MRB53_028667 [Persea americana]
MAWLGSLSEIVHSFLGGQRGDRCIHMPTRLDPLPFPLLKCPIGLQSVTDALLNEEEACFKIICSFRLTPHRNRKAHYRESQIASPLIIKKESPPFIHVPLLL